MSRRMTVLKTATVPVLATLGLATLAAAPQAHATTLTQSVVASGGVAATSGSRPLMMGDYGSDVRAWQQDIDSVAGKIPGVPHIATDGIFGRLTRAATKDFQRFAHIAVDGIVGPQTRAAMNTARHGSPSSSGYVTSRR
ncbi:peptidoglycan-binding domain-containing protein [Flexivirga caeni]|nr:peptidoglycan-binding domain-containing protein [Flexivirga caeni]